MIRGFSSRLKSTTREPLVVTLGGEKGRGGEEGRRGEGERKRREGREERICNLLNPTRSGTQYDCVL